jgi:DNA repair protein RadC
MHQRARHSDVPLLPIHDAQPINLNSHEASPHTRTVRRNIARNPSTAFTPILTMQLDLIPPEVPPHAFTARRNIAREYKVVAMREIPTDFNIVETPEQAARYWSTHVLTHPFHNPDVECMVVMLLNRRNRPTGHSLVSVGILDSVSVHPREIFRPAIVAAAASIIIMHNHPSGDPMPSSADISATVDIIRAGQILKIEVHDHVITAERPAPDRKPFFSLRKSGLVAF